MRPRPTLVILTAAIAFAAGCGGASAGSNASNGIQLKSGDKIVAAAVKATKAQRSFHFVESARAGTSEVSIVADWYTTGEQHVTVSQGSKAGHLTVLLAAAPHTSRATLSVLQGLTGMSAKVAAELLGSGIGFRPATRASPLWPVHWRQVGCHSARAAERHTDAGQDIHQARTRGRGGQGIRPPRPPAWRSRCT